MREKSQVIVTSFFVLQATEYLAASLCRSQTGSQFQHARPKSHLQRVDEIRSIVTRNPNLIRGLASMHVVPLATPPLRILALKHSPHEDSAAQKEQRHVSKNHAVAGVVSWFLFFEEDVRGDHTIDVAGADDDADDDAALVHAFDVVAAPGEGVGDGGVDLREGWSVVRCEGGEGLERLTPMAPRKVPAYWMFGLSEAIN